NLTIGGKEEQLFGEVVNANLLDVLGVQPALGRGFSTEEDVSPRPVVVLSHALWSRLFGNDPQILGRAIQLDQQEYTVVGVMPSKFHDVGNLGSPNFWIPMTMHDQALNGPAKDWFNLRAFRLTNM